MNKKIIWRDDDVNVETDLSQFKRIHDVFNNHAVMHTVSIIAKGFDRNKELVDYLKRGNFDIQLHCWEHYRFTDNLYRLKQDIASSLKMFEICGFDKPSTIYPPWNITNGPVNEIINSFGLTVSTEKTSLSKYVRKDGKIEQDVVNFHYWADECKDLDEALSIYNKYR